MRIEKIGIGGVRIIRNKRRGIILKKKTLNSNGCKGCCLKKPNNYMCLKYGHLLTDICNEEKIIFRIANEDSKR